MEVSHYNVHAEWHLHIHSQILMEIIFAFKYVKFVLVEITHLILDFLGFDGNLDLGLFTFFV